MILKLMRNILGIIIIALMMTSCSQYQRVLKNDDIKPKYDLATKYYQEGLEKNKKPKFKRALRLLEQILPQYRGKPQGEKLAFMYADSFYQLKDFMSASYQFGRFTKSYPSSDKIEEASYKGAKSYYYASPTYSLDQTETDKALERLQSFITKFPSSEHVGEANEIVAELREKLEKKNFEIAKLYYGQDDWKAAVAAMGQFVNDNPGSPYLEQAYYYKMDAEYELAIKSFKDVMKERLKKSQKYAADYMRYYPNGEYAEQVKTISEDLDERIKNFSYEH